MIYVYFTRNIYTLKFHYYGSMWGPGDPPRWGSDFYVSTKTNGYSTAGADACVVGGELNFAYNGNGNEKKAADVKSHGEMPVPKTITIRAKYGADLRDVWPVARPEEHVMAEGEEAAFISWAVTDGQYRTEAAAPGSSHPNEYTIMGAYGAMGSEIIAKPEDPDTTHHLVAYWCYNSARSYYRFTHCYEVPGLDTAGIQKVSIYNGDTSDPKNVLYLVPMNNAALAQYEFHDLMKMSYKDGQIIYDDPEGTFYAVREYRKDGGKKYYALARQVTAVSTNIISKQAPSARQHLTRVNGNPDHSARYGDGDGGPRGPRVGTAEEPYDLYFYYDRDWYTITYMVPVNAVNNQDTEETLGTILLPYGALVTQEKYGFALDYTDTNQAEEDGAKKYPWTAAPKCVSVCPDRAPDGKAQWRFAGWGLGPAGLNMQWNMPENGETQGQAGGAFAMTGNLRLYAIWETPSYTVTFHLNGGTVNREQIEVKIPANTRYSASGSVPRPLRDGYTLSGWYETDENGTVKTPQKAFDFDKAITADQHVAARWTAVSAERFDYSVYYVTKRLSESDRDKNPTRYTTKDTFTAVNPAQVYEEGRWYQFSHWSLGSDTTEKDGGTGFAALTVEPGTVGNLSFVANWKEMTQVGGLAVCGMVDGNAAETDAEFHFTVTLTYSAAHTPISGTFGDMTFADGKAVFALKHGETKTAAGLPAGTEYVVVEEEADQEGYSTSKTGDIGTIRKDTTAMALFNNRRDGGEEPKEPDETDRPAAPKETDRPTAPRETEASDTKVPASERPERETSAKDSPKTGDDTNLALWFSLCGAGMLMVLEAFRRRQREK